MTAGEVVGRHLKVRARTTRYEAGVKYVVCPMWD